ncbi:hypothetical protein [Actinomadura latina]|uniref:CU044_5270 family protein n=1 Tax=Actinomadura latina TaxID=163603 RepID=A0A846Z3Q0_9ACTN|nr:hypothetical protein [Actinomadura latina]NKZ05842.1 hypothetical protein [Actinomadura latina]
MNDDRMIRALLLEEPPSEDVVAEGRRRLHAGKPAARRQMSRRPVFGLAGAAAAMALAVGVATVLTGGGTGSDGEAPQLGSTDPNAQRILLAAADHASTEAPGRYWHVVSEDGNVYRVGGADGYSITYGDRWDRWKARSSSDPDVEYAMVAPGARPLTPKDADAWKKAGSPQSMRVEADGHRLTLTTKDLGTVGWEKRVETPEHKKASLAQHDPADIRKKCAANADRPSECEFQMLALEQQLQKFGENPDRYKTLMLGDPRKTATVDYLWKGLRLITLNPVSASGRSVVFRAMADLPGVKAIGTVKDAKGRTGIGLAMRDAATETRVVLDPDTYRLMGFERIAVDVPQREPGDVLSYTTVTSAGWTNEQPHRG